MFFGIRRMTFLLYGSRKKISGKAEEYPAENSNSGEYPLQKLLQWPKRRGHDVVTRDCQALPSTSSSHSYTVYSSSGFVFEEVRWILGTTYKVAPRGRRGKLLDMQC